MIRTRIAPTPSGFLHRGNAFNFLLAQWIAGEMGSLRLRIDDLDAPRIRTEYVQDIFDTMEWLGIRPDTGPVDAADQLHHYSQQLRLQSYEQLLTALADQGHVFACTCSRKDLQQHSRDGLYAGTCRFRKLPLDTPDAAWRLRVGEQSTVQFKDAILGDMSINVFAQASDFVVRRRDGLPAYFIASLADDVTMDINTIVRGEDLLVGTAVQLYLAQLLHLTPFLSSNFYHHPLLGDDAGNKLSKSAGASALKTLRDQGLSSGIIHAGFNDWRKTFMPHP